MAVNALRRQLGGGVRRMRHQAVPSSFTAVRFRRACCSVPSETDRVYKLRKHAVVAASATAQENRTLPAPSAAARSVDYCGARFWKKARAPTSPAIVPVADDSEHKT